MIFIEEQNGEFHQLERLKHCKFGIFHHFTQFSAVYLHLKDISDRENHSRGITGVYVVIRSHMSRFSSIYMDSSCILLEFSIFHSSKNRKTRVLAAKKNREMVK